MYGIGDNRNPTGRPIGSVLTAAKTAQEYGPNALTTALAIPRSAKMLLRSRQLNNVGRLNVTGAAMNMRSNWRHVTGG